MWISMWISTFILALTSNIQGGSARLHTIRLHVHLHHPGEHPHPINGGTKGVDYTS